MIRAYSFRFYPNSKQSQRLKETLELCRLLYNTALEQRRYARNFGQPVSYHIQQNQLPELKRALKEFKQVYSQVLQNVLRRVDFAFKNFFDRCSRRNKGSESRLDILDSNPLGDTTHSRIRKTASKYYPPATSCSRKSES